MRIHCLENVDKALQFLKEQRVHLENVGSHDIVDGNHRLTLGLIWTIILRFQVNLKRYKRWNLTFNCSAVVQVRARETASKSHFHPWFLKRVSECTEMLAHVAMHPIKEQDWYNQQWHRLGWALSCSVISVRLRQPCSLDKAWMSLRSPEVAVAFQSALQQGHIHTHPYLPHTLSYPPQVTHANVHTQFSRP